MIDYSSFMELLRARRSIRKFARRPLTRDLIDSLIEAAQWALSNHNRQPWKFIILDEPHPIQSLANVVSKELVFKLKRLPDIATAYANELAQHALLFAQAPTVIVVLHKQPISVSATLLDGLANLGLVSGEPLSTAMAVQNLMLAAHTLGLGTCVMTAPLIAQSAIIGLIPLPAGYDWHCLIALGYPDESPPPPRRKKLEQIRLYGEDLTQPYDDGKRNL